MTGRTYPLLPTFHQSPCWAHAPSYPHLWTKAQDTEFLYLAASHSNPLCWGRTLKPQTLEAGSDCPIFRCKLLQCIWRSQPASVAAWSRRSRTTHCTNLFTSSIIPPLILSKIHHHCCWDKKFWICHPYCSGIWKERKSYQLKSRYMLFSKHWMLFCGILCLVY